MRKAIFGGISFYFKIGELREDRIQIIQKNQEKKDCPDFAIHTW